MSSHVCLHLLLPAAAAQRVTDLLLAEGGGPAFSQHAVAARGPQVHLATAEERVQGHALRQHLSVLLPRPEAERLLAGLRAELADAEGDWWLAPVEAMGRLAPAPEAQP